MMSTIFQLMKTIGKSSSPRVDRKPWQLSNEPVWVQCPSSKHLSPVQETAQEYDDRKSTTERTLSAPGGLFHCPIHICFSHISSCFTVRLTFLFTTLVATRRCRCLLRSDKLVSCYALSACAMWSRGSWLGGSLVSAWCFCCFTRLLVWPGDFDVLPFVSAAIPSRWYNVIISCMN